MNNNIKLTENGINSLLQKPVLNIIEEVNIYLKITEIEEFKSTKMKGFLLCTLIDDKNYFKYFLLKGKKLEFHINDIICLKKIYIFYHKNIKMILIKEFENIEQINKRINNTPNELNLKYKYLFNPKKKLKRNLFYFTKDGKIVEKTITDSIKDNIEKEKANKLQKDEIKNVNLNSTNITINQNIPDNKQNIIDKKEKYQLEKDNNDINIDNDSYIEKIDNILIKHINSIMNISSKNTNIQQNNIQEQIPKHILIKDLVPKLREEPLFVKCFFKAKCNKEKEGEFFILRDETGDEITAYSYGEDAKKFDNIINFKNSYLISNYTITARDITIFINNNNIIVLNKNTEVKSFLPNKIFENLHFHYFKLVNLTYFRVGTYVDVIGIVVRHKNYDKKKSKYGIIKMKKLTIIDDSMKKCELTIFEPDQFKNVEFNVEKIIAIKYAKIGIFENKKGLETASFSCIFNTTKNIEKDIIYYNIYKKYNENPELFSDIVNDHDFKSLAEIVQIMKQNKKLNIQNFVLEFKCRAYVERLILNDTSYFKKCPYCWKKYKVEKKDDKGKYICNECKQKTDEPGYELAVNFLIRDYSGNLQVKIISTKAQEFLGVEVDIVKKFVEEKNYKELKKIENNDMYKEYLFTCKIMTYQNTYKDAIFHYTTINSFSLINKENLNDITD